MIIIILINNNNNNNNNSNNDNNNNNDDNKLITCASLCILKECCNVLFYLQQYKIGPNDDIKGKKVCYIK